MVSKMTEKEIFDIVQDVISHQFGVFPESIKPDTDLQHNFSMDSLDRVEVFMDITTRLKCQLTDEEENVLHESFNANPTPKTIVNFFCKKLNILRPNQKILYQKSVPELVAIIEWQRAELAKLRAQKR